MDEIRDNSTPCIVRAVDSENHRRAGQRNAPCSDLDECRVIESTRKLTALGLSARDIEALDIPQEMLQAICEYARLDDDDTQSRCGQARDSAEAVDLIHSQISNLELEIEMLSMRRRALKRRVRILEKLARSLDGEEGGLLG